VAVAAGEGVTVTESEWLACTDPGLMLEFLHGRASDRKLRLFAAQCCHRIWDLLDDPWSQEAVRIAERLTTDSVSAIERELAWDETMLDLERVEDGAEGDAVWFARLTAHNALAGGAYQAARMATYSTIQAFPGRPIREMLANTLRDIFANPFRTAPTVEPVWLAWNSGAVQKFAAAIYEARDFGRLLLLADALEDAGCGDAELLGHLRGPGPHVRGCWPVDLLTGKD
jgi:hypothetical protein